MNVDKDNGFSRIVNVFHGNRAPEADITLAGYAALIQAYDLQVPLPDIFSAIGKKHLKYHKDRWSIYTPRHKPSNDLHGQIVFALKNEGVNLSILKALFDTLQIEEITSLINLHPTGVYSRRIWFLYEWLQNIKLPLLDTHKGNYIDIVDPAIQYEGPSRISKRHRVRNNLPGTSSFCPMIRKTKMLDEYINMNLNKRAQAVLGNIHSDILMRAAAFLLLKDSKASYAIEGEVPPHNRAERWGQAIGQAGTEELSEDEFLRLQQIIIEDFRFTHFGYRNEGGFIGEHERSTGRPIPDHISARPEDLSSLMNGLIEVSQLLKNSDINPVLAAASIAFGFVFIHPFEDGNGRIHRYLIHHVLAEKKFTPAKIVFPVSSVILDHIHNYKETLESFSQPRLKFIKWRPTEKNNVEVLNETINLYRYFDATKQAEFLYSCIKETIEYTLPEEVDYLKKYDEMKFFIKNYIDMPDKLIDLLIRFLIQENGVLSNRAKRKEFNALKENEIITLENKYSEIFKK